MTPATTPSFQRDQVNLLHSAEQFAATCRALRATGRRIAMVPTMGALHEGHRELIRAARQNTGAVVAVSVFVNPLQFDDPEDLRGYPSTLEADIELCAQEGVELVFAPAVEQMYPDGELDGDGGHDAVTVQPGPLGAELEGAHRPGHFAGVLTVVAKLFGLALPDLAYFGEKDYQQLRLIHRMARQLHMGTRVRGVSTVREPDGLARSSRNRLLTPQQRSSAVALSAALTAGGYAAAGGADAALASAGEVLASEPELTVDYLELRAPDLRPAPEQGHARLLVAARLGTGERESGREVRLIDNVAVWLGDAAEGES